MSCEVRKFGVASTPSNAEGAGANARTHTYRMAWLPLATQHPGLIETVDTSLTEHTTPRWQGRFLSNASRGRKAPPTEDGYLAAENWTRVLKMGLIDQSFNVVFGARETVIAIVTFFPAIQTSASSPLSLSPYDRRVAH